MVSNLNRHCRGEREAMDPWSAARSEEGRAQGRNERPMRKEQKRLAKTDRQRRAAERRLQAPRPNHPNRVEDTGLRGGRESITRSELTSSEPPGSRPDSVWSIAPRGDDYGEMDDWEQVHVDSEEESADGKDCADEAASGETDGDEEDHVDSEDESAHGDGIDSDDEVAGHRPLQHLQCADCLGDVCPRSFRCTDFSALNYACRDTSLCTPPGRFDWLKGSPPKPDFLKAARGAAKEDAFQLLCRVRNSTLDESKAGELWDYHVGNDYYADKRTFASFRHWINDLFLADDKESSDSEEDTDNDNDASDEQEGASRSRQGTKTS